MINEASISSSIENVQVINQIGSVATITELQTVENDNAPSMIIWNGDTKPQVLLNVPSDQMLIDQG